MKPRHFKTQFFLYAALVFCLAVALCPAPVEAGTSLNSPMKPQAPVKWLVHTASAANIDPSYPNVTYIDNPLLTNPATNPDYNLWVTPNWNPAGSTGQYNNHPVGVWYNDTLHRWGIVNQDGAAMVAGLAFNVIFGYSVPHTFCWPINIGNTTANYSEMNIPDINADPGAVIILTHYAWGGAAPGTLDNHNVGVAYDIPSARWRIYTEDGTNLQTGNTYCGLVASQFAYGWTHVVSTGAGGNAQGNYTWLDTPETNANRHALVFTTHNLGLTAGMIAGNHPLGVWYSAAHNGGAWSIFNQDLANMVDGDYYNVLVVNLRQIYLPLIGK
jgi:hypothetical protein